MDASTKAALDLDARGKALELALARQSNAQVDQITETAAKFLHFLESGEPSEPKRLPENSQFRWTEGFEQRAAAFLGSHAAVQLEFRDLDQGVVSGKFAWVYGITAPSEEFLKSVLVGLATPEEGVYFEIRRARMPRTATWARTERSPDDPAGLAI